MSEKSVPTKDEQGVQLRVGEWADQRYPGLTREELARHLGQEFSELLIALFGDGRTKQIGEEAADVALLLYSLSALYGFDLDQFIERKLALLESGVFDEKIRARRAAGFVEGAPGMMEETDAE